MRINDIITERDDIKEAPVGMLARAGNAIASKIPGSIGARAQGRRDVSKIANHMWSEFQRYIGQARLDPKAITAEQISQYVKQAFKYSDQTINAGLQKAGARPGAPLPKNTQEKAFLEIATVSMQATGGQQTSNQQQSQSGNQQQSQQTSGQVPNARTLLDNILQLPEQQRKELLARLTGAN